MARVQQMSQLNPWFWSYIQGKSGLSKKSFNYQLEYIGTHLKKQSKENMEGILRLKRVKN